MQILTFTISRSESGLRNLSALVQLRNSMEIRNYISLLTSILNRLSLETEANTHAQRHMRTVLIRTLCELESSDQVNTLTSQVIKHNNVLFLFYSPGSLGGRAVALKSSFDQRKEKSSISRGSEGKEKEREESKRQLINARLSL